MILRRKRSFVPVFLATLVFFVSGNLTAREAGTSGFRTPSLAVRSNLLAPLLNAGLEYAPAGRWSFACDCYWPWVPRGVMDRLFPVHQNCHQILMLCGGACFWMRRPMEGHAFGAVFSCGYYDMEKNWDGSQGCTGAAGIEYRYCMVLGRGNCRLSLELAGGYRTSRVHAYHVYSESGPLISSSPSVNEGSFSLIKAGVTLLIPIVCHDN